jgi:glycosyltransferase involved in cell wall biosynthesis
VKRKIQQYGISKYIKLLGIRKDILEIYSHAKAFIVPSLSEGFGFITAEAMFSGCLVIGNNTAGTKELFDNGKEITGEEIALRYSTQEQLIQHLIDVTNNPSLEYEAMILRGQAVAKQLYSIEENANKIHKFYLFIIQNNKKKS